MFADDQQMLELMETIKRPHKKPSNMKFVGLPEPLNLNHKR